RRSRCCSARSAAGPVVRSHEHSPRRRWSLTVAPTRGSRMTGMPEPAAKVSLTGVKPTGEPHLGNLIGAIRPAIRLAEQYDSLSFIADYHALTTERDPVAFRQQTRAVAATWLAAGLDPDHTIFYRQSDVPEIFELTWALSCVTG